MANDPNSQMRSADLLVKNILSSPSDIEALKANPEEVLKKKAIEATTELPPRALEGDKWIYRIIVGTLGFVLVAVVLGVIFKIDFSKSAESQVPAILTALASACVGALAGILAPSPVSR